MLIFKPPKRTKAHCVNLWATDPSKYYDLDNKAAQPYSLCPGKEAPALHLSDGKAKRIWFTLGFPRPTSRHDKPYATPSWVADFVLPQYPGTIEVDENYCLNIALPGGPMQQCLTRSCINRPPYNGAPVKEINPYSLWNYYQDKIADPPNTCAGNKGASIPGNTGQIVGFNTGEQYLQPTFQEASFSTGSEEVGTISNNKNNNNGIVSASGTIPNVPDPALLDANSGFITIPESPFPVAAATPGDSYADSNNLPINAWTETINDWNKKNKRAAKLARRELLQRVHGSE